MQFNSFGPIPQSEFVVGNSRQPGQLLLSVERQAGIFQNSVTWIGNKEIKSFKRGKVRQGFI
jgi:hypothetical protein